MAAEAPGGGADGGGVTLPGVLFPDMVAVCERCGHIIWHRVSVATGHGRRCRRRVLGLNRAGRPIRGSGSSVAEPT
jgi:hypothetical protein